MLECVFSAIHGPAGKNYKHSENGDVPCSELRDPAIRNPVRGGERVGG